MLNYHRVHSQILWQLLKKIHHFGWKILESQAPKRPTSWAEPIASAVRWSTAVIFLGARPADGYMYIEIDIDR